MLVTAAVQIATFDGGKATTYSWAPVNDPVMGGQSVSTFHVDADRKVGVWDGEVKVVPFLKAPGFCNLMAPGLYETAEFPDLSQTTGLVARFSATGLTRYRLKLMTKGSHKLLRTGEYVADLPAVESAAMADHYVPWSAFKCEWRGQAAPDLCPELTSQLAEITNVGFGTSFPGTAGKFHLELAGLSARDGPPALLVAAVTEPAAAGVTLATFDGSKHTWHTENDPVMGGQSSSTFDAKTQSWKGSCRIVPKLHAPGFTIIMTEGLDHPLENRFPDISGFDGLTIKAKNVGGNVTSFKLAFCDSHVNYFRCQFGAFHADFNLPAGAEEVFVPWSAFSDKWDPATGKHKSEEPPTAASLGSVSQLQLWVEGVEGDFDLQLQSISATKQAAVFV